MIENKNCWLKGECNHRDCNGFCMRFFKLNSLYNQALISDTQRKKITLRAVCDDDIDSYYKLSNIQNNIEDFVNNGTNLYIHSTHCGNGKSSWALRLVQEYFNKIWVKSDLSCKALFINVPRFLLAIKENITEKSDYVQHIKDNILTADIVIWDDIATKSITTFEAEHLFSYIDSRISLGKSNIYTSNLNEEELHKAVGDRLYSRINTLSINIEFKDNDKRSV